MGQRQGRPSPAKDNTQNYYGLVEATHLVTWAVTAMKNSYSPFSKRKEGVLLRTEWGDLAAGTNVETVNWDGLTAIEVAIGQLLARQPWVDHHATPERIRDVIYALESCHPDRPDSYVPDGRSLDWLRRFGSPDTMLHFATPSKGIVARKPLKELLPHGPRMKALGEYLQSMKAFTKLLSLDQRKPEGLETSVWHGLRKSRFHAFAPYSGYRVGVVFEADPLPLPDAQRKDLENGLAHTKVSKAHRDMILKYIFEKTVFFPGINVELSGNIALHAEGCAIGGMITELGPNAKIRKGYLQGGFTTGVDGCTPCGKCRQLVSEFSTPDTEMITVSQTGVLPGIKRDNMLPGIFQSLR